MKRIQGSGRKPPSPPKKSLLQDGLPDYHDELRQKLDDPPVYQELRRLAAGTFRHERANHTLQPTALVHETLLRLFKHGPKHYCDQGHFLGLFSRVSRQILVDHARHHNAKKCGGGLKRAELEDNHLVSLGSSDLVALNLALQKLKKLDRNLHAIVEMRIFDGRSVGEIAGIMQKRKSDVRREWSMAVAWLQHRMRGSRL